MEHDALRTLFLSAVSQPPALDAETLDAELRARVGAGRAAWPELGLDEATFVRHLASHTASGLPSQKYAADLWLACACATGVEGAAVAFERTHGATLRRAVARVSHAMVDEVTQAVTVALFVSDPGSRPRIAEYGGRAALSTWLATVASNTALHHVEKRDNRAYESVGAMGLAAERLEPELAMARARHGAALDGAFREALGALDKRRKVILRLHHVQGWTIDRLATMYRVSRSAAGRLVIDARETLLEDTKRRLAASLKLTPSELESLVAVLQSNLQVSLVRLLEGDE